MLCGNLFQKHLPTSSHYLVGTEVFPEEYCVGVVVVIVGQVVGVVADERLDSFFVGFRPLAGLPFIQEKFVSNQNILPSVHQVIKSQSRAEDCRACAWACAGVQMSHYVYRVGMLFQVLRVRLGCLFPVEHNC